jgi:hypothetical protein
MAISGVTDLLDFTLGSEKVTGGDFTGTNGDPPNAWWDVNGGQAGNNQEIQSNKCQVWNTTAGNNSYIGRLALDDDYLGSDGARVPLISQVDFTLTTNPTDTEDAWGILLQIWASNDNSMQVVIGHLSTQAAPADWDTYGYGCYGIVNTTAPDPNSPNTIVNTSDTSGKLRVELVPYQSRGGGWKVEGRAYYWSGSAWVCLNPFGTDYHSWADALVNTGVYFNVNNGDGVTDPGICTADNFSVKTVTDHKWGKDSNRIGEGFFYEFANSQIRCGDNPTANANFYYPDIYEDGRKYKVNITVADYVDGECLVWCGNTLLGTITANGSYEYIGNCDFTGTSQYDELWLTSRLNTNDFKVTALTTEPVGGVEVKGVEGWSKVNSVAAADVVEVVGESVLWFIPPGTPVARYDASQVYTLDDTDTIPYWSNRSGSSMTLVNAVEAERPKYRTSQQNGLPGISFDGGDTLDFSGTIWDTSASDITIFIVAKITSGVNGGFIEIGQADSVNTGGWMLFAESNFIARTPDAPTSISITGAAVDTNTHIHTIWHDSSATTMQYWIDQASQGTSASGTVGAGLDFISVGSIGGDIYPLTGLIFEILIYNTPLSSGDRALAEDGLMKKWGL